MIKDMPQIVKCQACNGTGTVRIILKDKSGRDRDNTGVEHIAPCDASFCENGIVNMEAYHESWKYPIG